MNTSNRGFAGIVTLLVGVIIVVLGGLYFYTNNSSSPSISPSTQADAAADTNTKTPGNNGATTITPNARIQVTYPAGGEKFLIGGTYNIQWTNYKGTEALAIALQPVGGSAKIIVSNIPNTATTYKWTVGSETPGKYIIQVYPAGGREYVGYSKEFSVAGEPLITVNSPTPGSRVNMNDPLVITGKAKNIYNEGEFGVVATYMLDGKKQEIAHTTATCDLNGNGCNWASGEIVDFKATIDLSRSPVCGISLEFYKAQAKDNEPAAPSVYTMPIGLYGNDNCR